MVDLQLQAPEDFMHLVIICGSQQTPSKSRKVGEYRIHQRLTSVWGDEVSLFDLGEHPVPLWDPGVSKQAEPYATTWGPIAQALKPADAVICITPEWSGMATPAIKNFCCCVPLISWVASPHWRLACPLPGEAPGPFLSCAVRVSNNRLCWIPEHLIIRNAGDHLESNEPQNTDDAYIRNRIDYALAVLRCYAQALTTVRNSGTIDHENYPNGM